MKEKNKPKGTRVTRLVEGAEDTHFKSYFEGFYRSRATEIPQQDLDALVAKKRAVVDDMLNTIGEYTLKVYICKNGEPVPIPESEYGHFF